MTVRLDNPFLRAELDVSINGAAATTYFAHVQFLVCERWCKQDVGAVGGGHADLVAIKIGEGGWVEASGGLKVRREPEPELEDLDCVENPDRYPGSVNTFSKSLSSKTYVADRIAQAEVTILTSEANNPAGPAYEYWEVGLFDKAGALVAYATIDKLTKTSSEEVELVFRIYR